MAEFKDFRVELRGEAREVYLVRATSEEEARANWADGDLYISEAEGMEVVSVVDEDGD